MTDQSETSDQIPHDKNEEVRSRYIEILKPAFFPTDPFHGDIIRYFASLLRVVGMEDKGWDPHLESRALINDFYSVIQSDHKALGLSDLAIWRMGLIFYCHIVEMDAPYEVLANLLRFQLNKGYSPNPFYDFLNERQRKRFKNSGLYPAQKIEVIKQ